MSRAVPFPLQCGCGAKPTPANPLGVLRDDNGMPRAWLCRLCRDELEGGTLRAVVKGPDA